MKMLGNRPAPAPQPENPLWLSWHDTQMMPVLNLNTIMEYFCRKSNPFYDRMCNNETVRMQRLGNEHLINMVGVEFILLHAAEPILYVIRKQHRHSPSESTPIADYYVIGGMIYKAPDLATVINSRILSTVTNLQSAFEEASQYMKYNPNKGYSWDFTSNKALSEKSRTSNKKDAGGSRDDSASAFQMQRIDMLLTELLRHYPPPIPPVMHQQQMEQMQLQQQQATAMTTDNATNGMTDASSNHVSSGINNGVASPAAMGLLEPKQEIIDMKPPPEKKNKPN